MRFLLLVLFLLPSLAQAAPACMPGLYGTQVGNADYARTNQGWYAYWYCKRDDGTITAPIIACEHGFCLPIGTFVDRVTTMKRGENPIETIKAAWDAEIGGTSCASATGQLSIVCSQAAISSLANAPPQQPVAPPPPTYTHAVKINGTSTTRPAYLLTNGVRGTTAVGRANVGADCDLTKPTLPSGSDVWASFGPLFEAGKVALCKAK